MPHAKLTKHWDSLDRETVRHLQGRKLHAYLRDCVLPFSSHYQKVFAEAGLTADDIRSVDDLAKLPFTTKEDLLPTDEKPRRSLDFVLKPDPAVLAKRPGVILRALLRGRQRVRDELDREWRPVFTTATTGRSTESVAFLYSQHDVRNLGLGAGRIADLGGLTREDRMLNLFPFAPHLAFWYMYYSGLDRNIFCLSTGGGKVMGTEGNLKAIQKIRPQAIAAMRTAPRCSEKGPLDVQPEYARCSGVVARLNGAHRVGACAQNVGRVTEQGGQHGGGAVAAMARGYLQQAVHGGRVVELHAATAVDLKVDKAGHQHAIGYGLAGQLGGQAGNRHTVDDALSREQQGTVFMPALAVKQAGYADRAIGAESVHAVRSCPCCAPKFERRCARN